MVDPMEKELLACTYAALILYDDNIDITSTNISSILKAAGVTVNPYFPKKFAGVLQNRQGKIR